MAHPSLPQANPDPARPGSALSAVDAAPFWHQFAPELDAQTVLWSDIVPGGGHVSWLLTRGTSLRFVALDPRANCALVLYAFPAMLERYNMPDSLKAQHTAHFSRGNVLMSDMGRAMASVIDDTLGWHDPLGSLLDTPAMERRYGEHRYEGHRNAMHRSGRDGLLIEIGKHGLGARDLIAPVNLFSKVSVDEEGRFHYVPDHAPAGAAVELRIDMDVLVALSSAPHALNPDPQYRPGRVGIAAWRSGPAPADDYCRNWCPENARAHHNTDVFTAR
jgi:urea carboxylase-associated protein 2